MVVISGDGTLDKSEGKKSAGGSWGGISRVALTSDFQKPPFSRGDVGWAECWGRYVIVLGREEDYLFVYPCRKDGSTNGLSSPVVILESRVKATGVHREI